MYRNAFASADGYSHGYDHRITSAESYSNTDCYSPAEPDASVRADPEEPTDPTAAADVSMKAIVIRL